MFEYFACFTAHYTTTATSREVPDRETGNFLIFSLAPGGGGGGGGGHPDPEIRGGGTV